MDVYDMMENCIETVRDLEGNDFYGAMREWFGGQDEVILFDAFKDSILDADEEGIKIFHAFLQKKV